MKDQNTRNDHLPVYNIKAVSRLVGLLPVTLRAWERRYGLPQPHRGEQGYRLYSEHDLRTLHWLKAQIDAGMSIGRAVTYLNDLRMTGRDPATTVEAIRAAVAPAAAPVAAPKVEEAPLTAPRTLARQVYKALTEFDEELATEILRRAFAIYSVDQVLEEIISPTLVELGEAWHNGELPIATEHFATQFCMQHLMSLLSASAHVQRSGCIVAACAPGETHQIGLLILTVMLRWHGMDVKYLGPDLSLDRLAEALSPLHPDILLLTATQTGPAESLARLPEVLKEFTPPAPIVVLGGQAFQTMRLPETVPAIYLRGTPHEVVLQIERLFKELS